MPSRWRRGLVLLDRGDLGEAEAAFRVAVNLAPGDAGGATGLARVQMAGGHPEEAAATLEALLDRTPQDRYAYQLLGRAYRALGRAEEAEDAVAAGVSGEPRLADPWSDEVGAYRRGFAAMLKEATALGLDGDYAAAIGVLEQLRTRAARRSGADHLPRRPLCRRRPHRVGASPAGGRFSPPILRTSTPP